MLAARRSHGREGHQRRLQEPSEPDTFAFALLAYTVHSVVPVTGPEQRQAALSDLQPMIECSCAMFKERRGFVRDPGHEERVVLLGLQRAALEKRNLFIEHCRVTRCVDVL